MANRRILIVANQTAPGSHLKEIVSERMKEPTSFVLLVPAMPPKGTWTFTDDEAIAQARERMEEALAGLKELGAEIEGRVEAGSPQSAVAAFIDSERNQDIEPISEIVVSTLPPGASRWLHYDLPHRLERQHEIPVTHVIAEPARAN